MFKKSLITLFIALQLLTWPIINAPSVWAIPEAPSAPQAPSAPSMPEPPAPPSQPSQPSAPSNPTPPENQPAPPSQPSTPKKNHSQTQPEAPTPPVEQVSQNQPAADQSTPTPEPQVTASNTNTGADSHNDAQNNTNNTNHSNSTNTADINNDLVLNSSSGGNHSNKNTGDGSVVSGDATVQAFVQNQANTNQTSTGGGCSSCGSGGGSSTSNSKTGAGSDNSAATNVNSDTIINNNNTANLDTGVIAIADTGHNSANKNTGNGEVITGDANVGLTVVNVANTDIGGVKTSEFNVYDDHNGDILVDLSGNQATNFAPGNQATNQQTGADSTNQASNNSNTALTIVNNNDATVGTDLVINANTGLNDADKNTGNGSITTGDANVVTNVVNLVNNTIEAGTEIIVATVNIFGDLVGDIILAPLASSCSTNCVDGGASASNAKTGADSTNQASTNSNTATSVDQSNQANIGNQTIVNANTGENSTDKNTGNSNTTTGEVNVQAEQVNVANTNVTGAEGTWWIVVVNEAGRWVGKIFGSPDGANVAAAGTIDLGAANNTTGADSTNQASVDQNSNTQVTQNNQADVQNNVTINADTGHNSADSNTGNGSVTTGDVNVMSNVVNYVNNNILGGKVVITFVNVFGSWVGNVVTPGHQSEQANHNSGSSPTQSPQPAIGGTSLLTTITPTPTISQTQNGDANNQQAVLTTSNQITKKTRPSQSGTDATGYAKVLGAVFTRDWIKEEDEFLKSANSQTPQTQATTFKGSKTSWLFTNEGKLVALLLIALPIGLIAWKFKKNLADGNLSAGLNS